MARTNQDWYNNLGPFGYYSLKCQERNHKLISLAGLEDGSGKVAKGHMTFFCNTCNEEITTSVASYNASKPTSKSRGCSNCKKIQGREREAAKLVKNPPRRKRMYRRKWTNTQSFASRGHLINFLLSDPNPHNLRAVEFMERDPPRNQGKLYRHHIIPCHAGGEERKYNEVLVTELEHWEIHLLRVEIYKEVGDALIFSFYWDYLPKDFQDRLRVVASESSRVKNVLRKHLRNPPQNLLED
jgi:hypothetical protein